MIMHCNPAPPHPPAGEVYNVICLGRPYIDGYPAGYAMYAGLVALVLVAHIYLRGSGGTAT